MSVPSINSFLEYRPWRGVKNQAWMAALAIARESLKLIFVRKVFWVVFSLGLLNFLLYFQHDRHKDGVNIKAPPSS